MLDTHLLATDDEDIPPRFFGSTMKHTMAPQRLAICGFLCVLALATPAKADEAPRTVASPWWSLATLVKPPVPQLAGASHPVDAFIRARLAKEGLAPTVETDRRKLLRRLSFDLTGLPPTLDELANFTADKSPDAYERQIRRLLASPHYGERMAQSWLALAHYADSHGQDQDRARPNAWPYRDYLIRSFNADKPYSRFVQEQIAGDMLFPGSSEAIEATGFLAAGPWDESGLRDIREDAIDRIAAQYLDRDDIVSSVGTVFLGLTVGCARCHDHKFDPIPQEDYYALQAVFAGTDKAERSYEPDPAVAAKRKALAGQLAAIRALSDQAALAHADGGRLVQEVQTRHAEMEKNWLIPDPVGVTSAQGASMRVLIDRSILALGKRPEKDTTTVRLAVPAGKITAIRLEVLPDDTLPMNGPGRCDNGNLHLSEIRFRASGQTLAVASARADFDQAGWAIPRAIDNDPATAWGIHPQVGKPHQAVFTLKTPVDWKSGQELVVELDQLHGGSHLIGRMRLAVTGMDQPATGAGSPLPAEVVEILNRPSTQRTLPQQAYLARWVLARGMEDELSRLPPPQKVYCGTSQFTADGSFKPAPMGRAVHVLKRGDIRKPGDAAEPGTLKALAVGQARFGETKGLPEGERRAAFARWLTHPHNGLLWRVMANRVWQQHFGTGLVATPNDFGVMGGAPSHPELLDYLATWLRDHQGSLKELRHLLLTSETYRQACTHQAGSASKDADNRLLWRANRKRLEAEAVRDTVLHATGRLDTTLYGPPIKHYLESAGVHVTPTADYLGFNPDGPGANRRSLYRFLFRTRPDPFLEALDCPDASQSSPTRTESASPLQALALWNNGLMLKSAEHLAERAKKMAPGDANSVAAACNLLLLRGPTAQESAEWTAYAQKHGLASLCRVLMNTSEFLYVD